MVKLIMVAKNHIYINMFTGLVLATFVTLNKEGKLIQISPFLPTTCPTKFTNKIKNKFLRYCYIEYKKEEWFNVSMYKRE